MSGARWQKERRRPRRRLAGVPARRLWPQGGHYGRGYLPHIDAPDAIQHVVFRVGDALPDSAVATWRDELGLRGSDKARAGGQQARELLRAGIERYVDAGHGECPLRDTRCAAVVAQSLLHFDGLRYRLLSWVVMPNHVHVVFQQVAGFPLAAVVGGWKSFSARQVNAILGRRGTLWQRSYFDRLVRSLNQLEQLVEYVEGNPVAAGLVGQPSDWRYSSAGWRQGLSCSET